MLTTLCLSPTSIRPRSIPSWFRNAAEPRGPQPGPSFTISRPRGSVRACFGKFRLPGTPVPSLTAANRSQAFIDSVLQLSPRIASFDCDGTLWSGDAGEGFFSWEIDEKLVPDEIAIRMRTRYAEYKRGHVEEDVMCGEMVTMHSGMIEADVQRMATRFFDLYFAERIFAEMRTLVRELVAQGCDVWAVSSTNEWVIRAAMRHFGIPRDHVLAAAAAIDRFRITDKLVRLPSGPGKPRPFAPPSTPIPMPPSETPAGTPTCSPSPVIPSPSIPIPTSNRPRARWDGTSIFPSKFGLETHILPRNVRQM